MAGLSTTDIRRLLKGAKYDIGTTECYCEKCGHVIPPQNQFPIISHIVNRGRCRYCYDKISPIQFFQEIIIFVCALIISIIFDFKVKALISMFVFYESVKVVMLIVLGHRKNSLGKQLIVSFLINIGLFAIFFVFLFMIRWMAVIFLLY